MARILKTSYFILGFLFLMSKPALAYIDPATTSYVVQIIAGIVLAGGAAVGIYWHKIKRFLKNRKKDKQ